MYILFIVGINSLTVVADESEEVESLAQAVVGTIEHILGESIQQYF